MDRSPSRPFSRAWVVRTALALVVVLALVPSGISALTHDKTALGPGTVESPAANETVVGVQGFHFKGVGNPKKPARLARAGPNATGEVITGGDRYNATWFYDVDPLPEGHLLVTATNPGGTVVFRLDPDTGEQVWREEFDIHDTHDVDLINGDQLLVANMRAYNGSVSNDRVFVYDRGNDTIVWEYVFRNHYPADTDDGYSNDWTHVNDVDKVREGEYLVSPRNFDQVILLNRSTNSAEWQLGADGNLSTLYEQHNPDYLESETGNPTVLVADSENDRVVEYARRNGSWERTWTVKGFNWPRDADRLPNGNTLVTDSLNHRVVEITPQGEVVWEFYVAWAPYDSERGREGSNGPTMADQGTTGTFEVHGGADRGPASQETFPQWLNATASGTAIEGQVSWFAERYQHAAPFLRPVWMSSWALAGVWIAVLVLVGWGLGELVYQRRRVAARLRGLAGRSRGGRARQGGD